MNQRQLFDRNPSLFTFTKTVITETNKQTTAGKLKLLKQYSMNPGNNDLYINMKPLLILGRIIMIIPCSKSNYSTYKRPKLSLNLIPVFGSILLTIWTFIQVISGIKFLIQNGETGRLGFMSYISSSTMFLLSSMEFIMYFYFLRRSDKLYRIFDKWSEIASKIDLEEDRFLKYLAYILIISMAAPLMAFLSLLADLFYQGSDKNPEISELEAFFQKVLKAWNNVIPYHPFFVVFHTVLAIFTSLSRMYVPPLVIFFSRAISFQFKKLIESATNTQNISEAHYANMRNKGKAFWQDLVDKHRGLVFLVRTINNFLSPIVFSWVALSIYSLSMQLFRGLSGSNSWSIPTYMFIISFGVELTTFVVTIISAAKVNKNAEKILIVLRNCPKEDFYDTEVCRLEHQVATGPSIGFSGLGCFVITKPFLIKVFNAVFTLEIIMLQSTPNVTVSKNPSN